MRVVVLLSGRGSNLKALLDHQANYQIVAIISNRPKALGLTIAKQCKVPITAINHKQFESRQAFDRELAKTIDAHRPDLVVLAGFMRILTAEFALKYQGRIINLHPSLLPKFPGLRAHLQALEAGESHHGSSVHFVIPELDAGPIIAQWDLPIGEQETEESLIQRTLETEHLILPKVVSLFGAGKIELVKDQVLFEGKALPFKGLQRADLLALPPL